MDKPRIGHGDENTPRLPLGTVPVSGNDGRVCISGGGPARIDNPGPVSVTAHGGDATLLSLEAHELKSIWGN